ncbi:T9SS type B sorting domain-containing protein [Mucilaginibacter gilvus]|uniref:T9SS type B sorting domain-containing protein n=1 Tax=Mucilaginibacter gilvus TaxID=2305909 RepID=A0A444MPD4_9SPHI|nr:gliding motility-associated C-terminal domain-containing protein [Mucilaginibacter gilvus]RWY52512.1 T9SS type B sorting domain-containing protein [Mucilaginibacter gilvus]
MKRVLHIAIYIIAILAVGNCYAQVPVFTYNDVNSFKKGTPITPLKPMQTGGDIPATVFCQITTFAGTGSPGAANSASRLSASFNAPRDLHIDAAGNIYIADAGNNMIRKISPDGMVSTVAGTGATGSADGIGSAATFNNPTGIALDKLGNIFVADRDNHVIRQINAAGVVSTLAGKAGVPGMVNSQGDFARFNFPTSIAVDKNGGLYVTDYGNNLVRHVGIDGTVSTIAGDGTSGWVDGNGTSAKLNSPRAAYYGSNELFYLGDDSHIRTIDYDNNVVTIAGGFFSGSFDGLGKGARFSIPSGIVRDAAGTIFVADYGSSLIRRYGTDDLVTNLASQSLNGPAGLDIDADGNLYIADEKNNVIRKMVTTGYYLEPALPAGLTFDSRTGEISGTPTQTLQASNYSVVGYNTAGKYAYSFMIEVREAELKSQVLTFGALADATVGDQDIAPGATSTNSSIPITYTSSENAVATIANGKIHFVGEGTAIITAHQKGNVEYAAAEDQPQPIKVGPEPDFAKPTVEALSGTFIFALDQFGTYTVKADQLAKITPGPQKPDPTITIRPTPNFTCEDIGQQTITVGAGYGPDPADPLNAEFDEPSAISYDASSGNFYVSDQAYTKVRKYGTDTRVTTLAGGVNDYREGTGPNVGFSANLLSIANDGQGNTYVCDVFNNAVRKITPDGVTTTFAMPALLAANGGQIFKPESIAVDRFNNIYVANKSTIFKVTPDGNTVAPFAANFNGITGLTFDRNGDMFVSTNAYNNGNGVFKVTPNRTVSTLYTVPSAAGFARLVVDSKGNVFVGSTAGVIYKITPDAQFSIYAGAGEGFADGSVLTARFHNPQGITIDPADNLYIADSDNHRIRKITPAGKVTTIAGSGNPGPKDNTNKSNAAKVTVQVTILSELKFSTTQTDVTIPAAASCPAVLPNYKKDAAALSTCANNIVITQSPAAGAPVTIGQPITVTLTATDNLGQTKNQTFTVSAVPLPKPTVTIVPVTSALCDGGPITFKAQTQGEGSRPIYNWAVNGTLAFSGENEFTSSVLKTGDKVTCTVINHDYCELVESDPSDAYTVSTEPSIQTSVTVSASTNEAICPGVGITFTATPGNVQTPSLAPSYQWKVNGNPKGSNSATFTANSLVNGDEVVCEMTSNIKCTISPVVRSIPVTVHVKTDTECAITIPNAFTPNGDGTNDIWEIPELSSFPDCNFSIFNRYGKLVYRAIGYSKPWDGVYNGAKLPAGTYYFIIDLKTGSAPLSGSVTILR